MTPGVQARLAELQAAANTDVDRAIRLAEAALAEGVEHPLVLNLVAHRHERAGDFEGALAYLRRALALAPADIFVLNAVGLAQAALGRHTEALASYGEAVRLQPEFGPAHYNLAGAYLKLAQPAEALKHFERAAALQPTLAAPLSSLAALAARQGDREAARRYATGALALDPDDLQAQTALARVDFQDGAFTAAVERIERLAPRDDLKGEDRPRLQSLLADALDGLGRADEAFALYEAASRAIRDLHAATFTAPGAFNPTDDAQRLIDYFASAPAAPWRDAPPARRPRSRGHIFLMGFPRSGTTLLEQVLGSHPDVVTLEERATLVDATHAFMDSAAGLDRLATLDQAEADLWRDRYWALMAATFGDVSDKVVLDKLPLHTPNLPLIRKLFPDATILFARRDPRDVVLSCFRRRFTINPTMYQFLTLEGAAAYYDAIMTLAERYFELLPLAMRVVRHEDLVADFDGEVRAILAFVGLPWNAGVNDFADRARTSANTPSASQLARGLNQDGVGSWRRYERQLAPVMGLLDPWAERFGYPTSETAKSPMTVPPTTPTAPARSPEVEAKLAELGAALDAAMAEGRLVEGFQLAEAALALGADDPKLLRLRGLLREQQGRLDEAIGDFEAALAASPPDFPTLNALGLCLARINRPQDAVARLDEALALAPDYAPGHFNRAWTLELAGDLAGAQGAYEAAARIDPNYADAFGALAALASRSGDMALARRRAAEALTINRRQPTAIIALAAADFAEGALDAAEQGLRGLMADRTQPISLHDRSLALTQLGDVMDRKGDARDAFAAYSAANQGLQRLHAPRFTAPGAETAPQLATRLTRYVSATTPEAWRGARPNPGSSPVAGHVFLLSFPRSGTTLLGQVLAAHPEVVTLDEAETLAEAARAFLLSDAALDGLLAADEAALDAHRDAYWRGVFRQAPQAAGKVFIDKLPMNTLGLPLIARLFPQAKILFALRDPRDVILSCFRRQFVMNVSTFELLDLAGAARFYADVMTLAQACRATLPLGFRDQRHEDLVADFEGQTRALCTDLGLAWTSGLHDFAQQAATRFIATPSAARIARGLDSEGIGGWRRYAEPLSPILPILAPWVERFGYAAD